jgi:hypothetical protein
MFKVGEEHSRTGVRATHRTKMKTVARVVVAILIALDVAVYIAAKFDFFTHYDPHRKGSYLRGHLMYWVVMLTLILSAGLIEILFPNKEDVREMSEESRTSGP